MSESPAVPPGRARRPAVPRRLGFALLLLAVFVGAGCDKASRGPPARELRIATTFEIRDSGLLANLLEALSRETGMHATVVTSWNEADLQLVPPSAAEEATSAPAARRAFCWTPCLVLGPGGDAKRSYGEFNYESWARGRSALGTVGSLRTASSASRLLHEIALSARPFVSRGDGSELHLLEEKLRSPEEMARLRTADFYIETGESMDRTLTIADGKSAYTLCDLATYLRRRRGIGLEVVLACDPELRLSYEVTRARPAAIHLADWLCSEKCRALLREFRIDGLRPFYAPGEDPTPTLRGRLDPEVFAEENGDR